MDVDDPVRVLGQECRGENLHVAGQHHKIDPAPQQLEHLLFLSFFSSGLDGQVVKGNAERLHPVRQVGVVADDQRNLYPQLPGLPAPKQVQQAVFLARNQNGHALGRPNPLQFPLHLEFLGHGGKVPPELLIAVGQTRQFKLHPHEEAAAPGVGRILIRLDDVGTGREQKPRQCGDDARPVRARNDQSASVLQRTRPSFGRNYARFVRTAPHFPAQRAAHVADTKMSTTADGRSPAPPAGFVKERRDLLAGQGTGRAAISPDRTGAQKRHHEKRWPNGLSEVDPLGQPLRYASGRCAALRSQLWCVVSCCC